MMARKNVVHVSLAVKRGNGVCVYGREMTQLDVDEEDVMFTAFTVNINT